MNDGLAPTKAELRARFRSYRRSLDAASHARLSASIAEKVLAVPEVASAGAVHAYWPMADLREVDTRPLISKLYERGTRIVLPCVKEFATGEVPHMEHRQYDGEEHLVCNRWGIFEPVEAPLVPSEMIDVVIVPAFGAGRNGHRIGHGRGYYDVFLSALAAFRICLIYHACLIDAVPAEPHDVPVDLIVTEKAITQPKAAL